MTTQKITTKKGTKKKASKDITSTKAYKELAAYTEKRNAAWKILAEIEKTEIRWMQATVQRILEERKTAS